MTRTSSLHFKNLLIILIAFNCRGAVFERFDPYVGDTDLLPRLDSLFSSDQKVFIGEKLDHHDFYVGGVMETFSLKAKSVIQLVQNYREYTKYFSLAKQVVPAEQSQDWESKNYYIELGIWSIPARVWSIVKVHDLRYRPDSTAVLYFHKTGPDSTHQKWAEKNSRRHRVLGAKEFLGYWAVRPVGEGRVRVAFVALIDPGFYVPAWLIRLAWRIMLPTLLNDIEKTLNRVSSTE